MKHRVLRNVFFALFLLLTGFMLGCSGIVYSPKGALLWYHEELPTADAAVENARQAGKDSGCPEEFSKAERMRDTAYEIYWQCRTEEGINMAVEAKRLADSLCPQKALAPPPPPPPPPPAPKVIDKLTVHVNFDFDKPKIKQQDYQKLNEAIEFIKKYPDARIVVEGHTDSIGTEEYNQKLSTKRAEAVMKYFITNGNIDESRISSGGYGESRPIETNKTRSGRAQNRRSDILILSE
ncbi:MAG: OmpA family protein [Candidatus Mariimomonas ferrooxydans]